MIGKSEGEDAQLPPLDAKAEATPVRHVAIYMAGETHSAPIYDRATLPAGQTIPGPAVIFDAASTTAVEPGWSAVHTARVI